MKQLPTNVKHARKPCRPAMNHTGRGRPMACVREGIEGGTAVPAGRVVQVVQVVHGHLSGSMYDGMILRALYRY